MILQPAERLIRPLDSRIFCSESIPQVKLIKVESNQVNELSRLNAVQGMDEFG